MANSPPALAFKAAIPCSARPSRLIRGRQKHALDFLNRKAKARRKGLWFLAGGSVFEVGPPHS